MNGSDGSDKGADSEIGDWKSVENDHGLSTKRRGTLI
jgi:hypothetical protein